MPNSESSFSLDHGPDADPVMGCAFTPDASRIASTASDDRIRVWDIGSGSILKTFCGGSNTENVEFTPDGAHLLVAGNRFSLFDIASGERVTGFKGHGSSHSVFWIGFTPDGSCLISAAGDDQLAVWDTRNGELQSKAKALLDSVALSPDGKLLAGAKGNDLLFFSIPELRKLHSFESCAVFDVAWTKFGFYVATDEGLCLVDPDSGESTQVGEMTLARLHGGPNTSLVGYDFQKAILIDPDSGESRVIFESDEMSNYGEQAGTVSADGRRFAFAWNYRLHIWDL